jgi:hypothetical protein
MDKLNREQLQELQAVLPLLKEIVSILDAAEDIGEGNVKVKVPSYLTAYFDKMFPNSRIKEAANG